MLNPFTLNNYYLKDSFEAVDRIEAILKHLYDKGYQLVSFDVKSLFTNVPRQTTINIIVDKIYNKKDHNNLAKKQTLKKLILGICPTTAFSYMRMLSSYTCLILYTKKTDGISMGV